jgi:hypothetical protein
MSDSPNFYPNQPFGTEYTIAQKNFIPQNTDIYPARDNRYPAHAAHLEDARLVTDYRPKCSKNVRPDSQYNTKLWLINHGNEIIEESRKRQEEKKITVEKEESESESQEEEEEEEEDDESEIDEEEYKKILAAQKAELKRKHDERMKKQQSFYTPPVPVVQEMPRIISNTKEQKPVKTAKK